jgi:y4mF family transcriptional regulator
MDAKALGRWIRRQRKRQRLRQAELAALSDVGTRFVSELERGKPTLEIGRIMRVAAMLGGELEVRARIWPDPHVSDD